jgi:CRP-like cAMP-binding protein
MTPTLEQRLSAFQPLNQAESTALKSLGQPPRTAVKGQQLLSADHPADKTVLIHRGWAIIYRDLSDGRRQIMQFCLPGDLVDPCSLLVSRRDFSIAAISPVRYSHVNLDDLTRVISQHPHLALPLLWNEAREVYLLRRHLLSIGRMTAIERLAALFLELSERLATAGYATDGRFNLHATQQMLGDATGLSAVHVSRTIRTMEARHLIKRSGRSMVTINQKGLQRLIPDLLPLKPR